MEDKIFFERLVEGLRGKIEDLYEELEEKDRQVLDLDSLNKLLADAEDRLRDEQAEASSLRDQLAEAKAQFRDRESRLNNLEMQLLHVQSTLNQVYASKTWRIGQFYGRCARALGLEGLSEKGLSAVRGHGKTHARILREEGLRQYLRYSWQYRKKWLSGWLKRIIHGRSTSPRAGEGGALDPISSSYLDYQRMLRQDFDTVRSSALVEEILKQKAEREIIVYPSPIPWNVHLVQRPHHILMELARRGYLVLFITPNPVADRVEEVSEVSEDLFVVGSPGHLKSLKNRTFLLWLTWTPTIVFKELFPKSLVVYDWIDELDVFYLYCDLMEKDHRRLIEEADAVFTSAGSLNDKARQLGARALLVQNGVNPEDFRIGEGSITPEDMETIVGQDKPLIGFYGSLEAWRMDYDLVNYLVRECQDLNFVLIGPSYDGSSDRLDRAGNLFLLGPKKYEQLKYYLNRFDVAVIPYIVNRVTDAVFPVKLCEYMAAGKPVVTTDMRECRNFKTVFVSRDAMEFAHNIRQALTKAGDAGFSKALEAEARDNTWEKRVDIIIGGLQRLQGTISIRRILERDRGSYRGIVVYPPTMDWNLPLFQRPHHLALQLARLGYLTFYCTANHTYDSVDGVETIGENLYLTDRYEQLTKELSEGWLIVSSVSSVGIEEMRSLRGKGFHVVYDYLDEIHEDISGGLTGYLAERHRLVGVGNVDLVAAISTKLCYEMKKRFPDGKVLCLPNGVDYEHFHRQRRIDECPADLREIVREGKPIIGYHGAFAQWIDYDLINYMADRRPDWNIVLIGWNYDGSMSALGKKENIRYLGLRQYHELPKSSIWFDVAMIPFKGGDIAKSTSPIKLFEYMAMQKPTVVTRDLIECRGEGVLRGADHDDFIRKVEEALVLKDDPAFLSAVDKEARSNTWQVRAERLAGEMETITRRSLQPNDQNEDGPPGREGAGKSEFAALLCRKWGVRDIREVKEPVHAMWLQWALSTFKRGESIRGFVSRYTEIAGKRYMDVGCGYGGFLVAFSRAGAKEAIGLEINPVYFEYYAAIAKDCGLDLHVFRTDIMDQEALGRHGKFDIITCNDVVEHVDDPAKALANMAEALSDGGLLFLQIPNRFSAAFIEADGHFKLFGITLLPKWMADTYHGYSYHGSAHDVRYRSLPFYLNTLKQSGLGCELTNYAGEDRQNRLEGIRATLDRCMARVDGLDGDAISEDIRRVIGARVSSVHGLFNRGYERYLKLRKTDADAADNLAKRLIILFGEDFWQIVARREDKTVIPHGKA